MKGSNGDTDNDWFAFLFQQPGIDEVNFWQPRADVSFQARQQASPSCLNCATPAAPRQPTTLQHVTCCEYALIYSRVT